MSNSNCSWFWCVKDKTVHYTRTIYRRMSLNNVLLLLLLNSNILDRHRLFSHRFSLLMRRKRRLWWYCILHVTCYYCYCFVLKYGHSRLTSLSRTINWKFFEIVLNGVSYEWVVRVSLDFWTQRYAKYRFFRYNSGKFLKFILTKLIWSLYNYENDVPK